jgi:peptidoglycan/xylan/chitin deacetylase (PgdA/CDA1 family)
MWALKLLSALTLVAFALPAGAQMRWPQGKTFAIVLTYDDALHSQLQVAAPRLASAKLHGTFFLQGTNLSPADMLRWRAVQAAGNELGNHSLFHPCPRDMLPKRTQYYIENYDASRLIDELAIMNGLLFGIDGLDLPRTYSGPCSQMLVGGVDVTEALRRSRVAKYIRTGGDAWKSIVTDFARLDPMQVPSWGPVDGPGGAELIAYVERVRAAHGLGVFQFHGVGGDYLSVSAQAHDELIAYLAKQPDVWVAPFQETLDYVFSRDRQEQAKPVAMQRATDRQLLGYRSDLERSPR